MQCITFRGEKAKLTLWGDLAHYLSEDDIGNHKVLIITSMMVFSPRFKGKFCNMILDSLMNQTYLYK
jgi:hypothetical protein